MRRKGRRGETESLVDGNGAADESKHNAAPAEDVLDRLFDAFDVHNAGDVDFFEFASALSVSWCVEEMEMWLLHKPVYFRRGHSFAYGINCAKCAKKIFL